MTSLAFQSGRIAPFSPAALQQKTLPSKSNAAIANAECGCTDTSQSYVARGIIYGLLISAPLWVIIGGAVFLACHIMD